jgi:hypothetical protein
MERAKERHGYVKYKTIQVIREQKMLYQHRANIEDANTKANVKRGLRP